LDKIDRVEINSCTITGALVTSLPTGVTREDIFIIDDKSSIKNYSGEFSGFVKDYDELVEALKYRKADIILETKNNEFHITGPLVVTGEAQINWAKGETVYVDESVTADNVITNNGTLRMNGSDGKLVNNSTATLFNNNAGKEIRIQCVDITSASSKYDIWNEGNFNIYSDDESQIVTDITMNSIWNTGGTLTIHKANITSNFMNQSNGQMTIYAGHINGNLNFPEVNSGNQNASISISKSVTWGSTKWNDSRINWLE